MSPKTKKKPEAAPKSAKKEAEKPVKKAAGAKEEKPAKVAKAAKGGKGAKGNDDDDEVAASRVAGDEGVDLEELEEAAEEAASRSSGGGGNAAAIAAAGGESASFKNFRHHPDMENFYRFIYENDLRHEALAIVDKIMIDKLAKKAAAPPTKSGGKHK